MLFASIFERLFSRMVCLEYVLRDEVEKENKKTATTMGR
jgi:hypothetical protein